MGVIQVTTRDASMSEQPASQSEGDRDRPSEQRREGMEFADASLWLSRIFTAIVPGLIGLWLDDRFGTRYFALIGLILGLISGIANFAQASKGVFSKPAHKSSESSSSSSGRKLP